MLPRKVLLKLEKADPERAKLARAMATYLSHLRGLAERGDLRSSLLRIEERSLEAKLGRLPDDKEATE